MNIIKALRKQKGIQQKDLAQIIGVSRPTVCDWEANRKDPKSDNLKKLAQYFEVDELVILGANLPQQNVPTRTLEAQIIADAIDKLPKKQRVKALSVMQVIFSDYNCFE